jgi:hypothetical protein
MGGGSQMLTEGRRGDISSCRSSFHIDERVAVTIKKEEAIVNLHTFPNRQRHGESR